MADEIIDETQRGDLRPQILKAIQRVVTTERKNLWWFQERRLARITLVPGQIWYGRFDALSAERLDDVSDDGATRLYEDGGEPPDHMPWGLEGPEIAGGDMRDLQSIDDVHLIDASTDTRWWRMKPAGIQLFNRMRDPQDTSRRPEFYCWYNSQLGFDPIPDGPDVIRIFGKFRSIIPGEHDSSVLLDEAENLIAFLAKEHLYRHYLEDAQMADQMANDAMRERRTLKREQRQRTTTGRLAARR